MAENDFQITRNDLYEAADSGVISHDDSRRLIEWAEQLFEERSVTNEEGGPNVETSKGFNLVTVAYYFGAMLMIVACGWFLGDKWETLGSSGVLVTTVVYFVIAVAVGTFLRRRGYLVGGGLLITVAVCLVPLITYSIQDVAGLWPKGDPESYGRYYTHIHVSFIVMELATIAAAIVALAFVRFGFLTAPAAFSFWFFSMDVAGLILGDDFLNWNGRAWVSILVGTITIVLGYCLDRLLNRADQPKFQDFAFWCYLFGLLAFWGGLTSLDSGSEYGKAIYAVINLGLIGVALKLKRPVFMIFGVIGFHFYLGHLAYRVFEDSVLFPFIVAFLGLSVILITVFAQRLLRGRKPV